jgi:addiction module HigA family antidote
MAHYPSERVSIHPGEMLLEEYLKPEGISQAAFARHIGVDVAAVSEIVNGKRGLSPEMCFKFASAFGQSPEMWWGFQESWEFTAAREKLRAAGRLPAANPLPEYAETAAEWEAKQRSRPGSGEEIASARRRAPRGRATSPTRKAFPVRRRARRPSAAGSLGSLEWM